MISYVAAAIIAKIFSINSQTERLYRYLGNILLTNIRIREGLPARYIDRVKLLFEYIDKYDLIQTDSKLLELGTGWVHWESTCVRLFHDVDITMYDVCDNRLLKVYKMYFEALRKVIGDTIDMTPEENERVSDLLYHIISKKSFETLYNLLGLTYVIEPTGTLHRFQDESFDVIISFDVLEHVKRDILPGFVHDIGRMLKPGAFSIHQIDISDHLAYFAPKTCKKNYLRYSNNTWKYFFENKVQYINRVQRSEWFNLFRKSGLNLVEEKIIPCEIDNIRIHEVYDRFDRIDLECSNLMIVLHKPFSITNSSIG